MQPSVFISLGRIRSEAHERFANLVYEALVCRKLRPRGLEVSHWSSEDPLRAIHNLMGSCSGVVVIALPRLALQDVIEFPDSQAPELRSPRMVSTIWSQIEASLAYTMRLPLISLVDSRIHAEALLNPNHEAYNVIKFDLRDVHSGLPGYLERRLDQFQKAVLEHVERTSNVRRISMNTRQWDN